MINSCATNCNKQDISVIHFDYQGAACDEYKLYCQTCNFTIAYLNDREIKKYKLEYLVRGKNEIKNSSRDLLSC